MFEGEMNRDERNVIVLKAYTLGYSQHAIAQCLGVSQPCIHNIIKQSRL